MPPLRYAVPSLVLALLACSREAPPVAPAPVASGPVDATTASPPPDDATAGVDAAASAPDAAASPDSAAAGGDATAPADLPEPKETAIAVLVPRGDDFRVIACWIVPAADAPWAPMQGPRWGNGDECVARIAVGAEVHGLGATGKVSATEGGLVKSDAAAPFLIVAPEGDRRLASVIPIVRGPLHALAEPAAGTPARPEGVAPGGDADARDGTAASDAATDAGSQPTEPTPPAAVPEPTPPAAVPERRAADADEQAAVTRAVKRLNGGDYPSADITVGDAVVAEMNGDDKLDRVLLASSFDADGEGHSAGGGAWFADGRTPARLVALATEGQMTDIDLLALSDLDGDGRKEVLVRMECPTGSGFYFGQWAPEGLAHLGEIEEDGVMCAGLGSEAPPLPYRAVTAPPDLGAFVGLLGGGLAATDLASRYGAPIRASHEAFVTASENLTFLVADGKVRGLELTRDGARAAAARGSDVAGLDRLLDFTPRELAGALRPTLGRHRLMGPSGLVYDGALPDGRGLLVRFTCADDQAACDRVRIVAYAPRKGLTSRMSFLGLSRQSKAADVEKLFGAVIPGSASDPVEHYAAGKVAARYDEGGSLAELTVEREAALTLKRPGPFAMLGEPMAAITARLGPPDETATAPEPTSTWRVPSPLAEVFSLSLRGGADGTCSRISVRFR